MRPLAALIVSLLISAGAEAAAPFDPLGAATLEPRLGARLPLTTRLTDDAGREVALRDLIGDRPAILAPVYYRCPNICGLTLSGLFGTLAQVGLTAGADYDVIAFSIDPRETPAVAAEAREEHLAAFPTVVGDGISFLTGSEAAARTIADAIGFGYAWDPSIGQYAHAAAVAVVTPEGLVARYLRGLDAEPADLRLALVESGGGRIGTLVDRFRMLCFSYDPQTGRYTPAIMTFLRLACGLVVIVLGGWLALQWRRERRLRSVGGAG